MALARRTAPRYADAPQLGAFGLPSAVLLSVPGYFGTVAQTGTGAATVAPSGSPAGVYDVRVRVTTGGAPGTGAVQVSLNGGTSYGAAFAVPASGVVAVPGTSSSLAAGMKLTVAGVLVLGDVYAFDAASNVELALDAASDWLDGYLARRYTLPLTAWDMATGGAAAAHAALQILTVRGFNPEGDDKAVVNASDSAERWAEKVAQGWITPKVTDSSTDTPAVDPVVASRTRRRFR